ncbi:MAG: hypothetical protein CVT76_01160 [Alphaproteobacteria bacterium HGW-Alphaproteobacteria-15]|nr:MAG: hypothetical protein CVT76_01160 [Alphaproteobacteria bacterium HGW-Alphaproteobacteria-15]
MLKLPRTIVSTAFAALALAATPAPVLADGPSDDPIAIERAAFEADRARILAMAGDYRVSFDMQESTAWMEGYDPIEAKISGGFESVRVIEDTGNRIVLQHLLVVGEQDNPYVVKHWRQDWEYEPERVLVYVGGDEWQWNPVPESDRAGRWSQTVYQVDDSPRYAGLGKWDITNGVARWRSNWTTRPLARRDAVRSPIYDRYVGINRHQLTPNGWIHWQDNTKMMPDPDDEGKLIPVVQEYVLNTYERFDGYNVAAADAYWASTAGYWAAVRDEWSRVAQADGGIVIAQEANYGTDIAAKLLELADAIKSGETSTAAAKSEAIALIGTSTARRGS